MPGIVVGVDGSPGAVEALEWALEAAQARHQVLTVLTVVPTPVLPIGWTTHPAHEPAPPEDLAAARQAVDQLIERLRSERPDLPVQVEVRVEDGPPTEVLLRYAHEADHLVVGSRGVGGFKRLLLGSVSTAVVHHANCPVTVVPPPQSERYSAETASE